MGIDWPFDDGDDVAGDRTFVHLKGDHGHVFASGDRVWTDMALDRMHLDLPPSPRMRPGGAAHGVLPGGREASWGRDPAPAHH